jgi:hypothetical protein
MNNLVPIERRDGVTLYGKVVGKGGKLGQYEVHSDWTRYDGQVYAQYHDAETKMSALIGVQSGKAKTQN